jgi:hypothetical protein
VGELDAQAVYDLFFKPFLTRFARDAAFIQQKIPKAKRATLAKQYQADAKNTADGGEFYGPDYLGQLAAKVLPEDAQHAEARSGRTLGIMMRRQLDGTWPTVVKMLQTVLQDYDPALAKELKGAL